MNKMKVEVIPCSATPLIYDDEKCIGCNACADICQCDIILPNPEKGKHPIVMFDMLPSYRTMKYKSPIWGYFHVQKE